MAEHQNKELGRLVERFKAGELSRRDFIKRVTALGGAVALSGTVAGLVPTAAGAAPAAQAQRSKVRKLQLLTEPQAAVPEAFDASNWMAAQLKKIGIDTDVQVMPYEQQSDLVWYKRDQWDMTEWQMVGRPERLDPDEFVYNLFHSSTAKDGYNFVGYINPEYDKVAEAQRVEMDQEKRKALIDQAQQIIGKDQPFLFWVYPHANYAYSTAVWDPKTVVDAAGLGIKNYLTFVNATPLGDQKDMILNTQTSVQAINPLYISGGVDSWVTELIWDRLMRIDKDGLPQPAAAEKVEWKDDTTALCTIRSGMKWHDGQPVTLDDIIFSFQAPAGDLVPMYKPFVAGIESVTKVGDNQLQFKLKTPNAAFETSSLSKVNLVPKHVWEPVLADLQKQGQNAEKYQEKTPIGSGPFKYVNWARSQEIDLEAVPDHYAAPKMGKWILRDMPNVSAAVGALQSSEINFLSDYTGDPQLLKQTTDSAGNLAMVSTIVVGFRFLAPNARRAPLDDPALRRAMAMVTGRQLINQNIFKGFADVADSHVSKALKVWHADGLPQYAEPDIEGAKKELQAAGYSWDEQGALLYPEGKTEKFQTGKP